MTRTPPGQGARSDPGRGNREPQSLRPGGTKRKLVAWSVRFCKVFEAEAVVRSLGFILNPVEDEIMWAGYCAECPGESQ